VGDNLPPRPPGPAVWGGALLNRSFKTNVISMIVTLLARNCEPLLQRKSLIIDFVNVVRVDFSPYDRVQSLMPEMQHMSESDIKFMRYASKFGDLVVEPVDSDVVLIAMMYLQRTDFQHKIYVKRIKSNPIDEDVAAKRKRVEAKTTKHLEYEVVCVNTTLRMLRAACKEAVGPELVMDEQHLTYILVCLMLPCGSDYSRRIPRVGAKAL